MFYACVMRLPNRTTLALVEGPSEMCEMLVAGVLYLDIVARACVLVVVVCCPPLCLGAVLSCLSPTSFSICRVIFRFPYFSKILPT